MINKFIFGISSFKFELHIREEIEPYVNITIKRREVTYNGTERNYSEITEPLHTSNESGMISIEPSMSEIYFNNGTKVDERTYLCFNESSPDLYLQGSLESTHFNKSNAFVKITADRCKESSKCASDETIDEWLYGKLIDTPAKVQWQGRDREQLSISNNKLSNHQTLSTL